MGLMAAALPAAISCSPEKGARPNIVVILADDMGYSDLGCYGGEIETPNLDNLAENGIRYRQFYNNARSCPSRAVLMTGLYPHQAGMGWMAAADLQTPQYQGHLNNNCVTIAEVLKEAGYGTYMCGKWHLSSDRQNQGKVEEAWPAQRGFDRFYGIPSGASNYFKTTMYNENTPSPTPEGFYITTALSDSAATFISRHDYKEKPLFMYLAFNAPHWPLHAPQQTIDKYAERYMAGWDRLRQERFERQKAMGLFRQDVVLSPRDKDVQAWDSLTPEEQKEFAMRMAIYAAQVDLMDQGIGKVVQALKETGQFDNTIIMFMSDNGACAEFISGGKRKAVDGKEDTHESYRINWANLSSTPYREYKHYTNEGGIATPLIVSWPEGIDSSLDGTFIDEYGYFADIMATCVDVAGAEYPETYRGNEILPMEGVSLVPNFSGGNTGRGMTFWEHEANIAVRDGKWKIVLKTGEGNTFKPENIELYDMEADPTEMNNLAASDPERTANMFKAWEEWAERVHAYPLDTRFYGERQAAYKRVINGEFDDNFGGWSVKEPENGGISFSIDTASMMSGTKCARADIAAESSKDADAFLKWNFPSGGMKKVRVAFDYKADGANTLSLKIEKAGAPAEKLFSETVAIAPDGGQFDTGEISIPEDGRWQVVFYFGKSSKGRIWIDNVKMDFRE